MNIMTKPDTDYRKEQEMIRSSINEKVSDFELILPRGDETEYDNEVINLLKRKRKRLEELDREYRKYKKWKKEEELKEIIDEIDDILCAHPTALQPNC